MDAQANLRLCLNGPVVGEELCSSFLVPSRAQSSVVSAWQGEPVGRVKIWFRDNLTSSQRV